MTIKTHTKTPWKIGSKYGNTKIEIVTEDGSRMVATVLIALSASKSEWEPIPGGMENAELIVEAVNAYTR